MRTGLSITACGSSHPAIVLCAFVLAYLWTFTSVASAGILDWPSTATKTLSFLPGTQTPAAPEPSSVAGVAWARLKLRYTCYACAHVHHAKAQCLSLSTRWQATATRTAPLVWPERSAQVSGPPGLSISHDPAVG